MPKKKKILTVRCLRCGYEWEPDARKWRNLNNIIRHSKKIVFCPSCNNKITLSDYQTYFAVMVSGGEIPKSKLQFYREKVRRLGKGYKGS